MPCDGTAHRRLWSIARHRQDDLDSAARGGCPAGRSCRAIRRGGHPVAPEFATVATQFRATGEVVLDALLDASARFVTSARNYDLVVTDTLFPFVPSLLAWGHDETTIRSFLSQLHTLLRPLHPIVVYLDGEPAEALSRAASRSGDAWLRVCLAKASTYKTVPPIQDLADTVAHLRHERDVTLQAMIDTGYSVVVLPRRLHSLAR